MVIMDFGLECFSCSFASYPVPVSLFRTACKFRVFF